MESWRLFLIHVFIIIYVLVIGMPYNCYSDESSDAFDDNASHRVYRAGPSNYEIQNNIYREELKEEKAWHMLENLILDTSPPFSQDPSSRTHKK